jgi:DNA-binding transcriptional LysR family regulator
MFHFDLVSFCVQDNLCDREVAIAFYCNEYRTLRPVFQVSFAYYTTEGIEVGRHAKEYFDEQCPSSLPAPADRDYATLQLPGALHVNSAQTYEAAALAGLGLIQAPLMGIGRYLESGALVEIMPDFRRRALAVSLVVAHRSNLSRRVRAFMKWIEDVLTPYLE